MLSTAGVRVLRVLNMHSSTSCYSQPHIAVLSNIQDTRVYQRSDCF